MFHKQDNELSLSKDFVIFRKDRVGARGGGVIAAVKSNICARAIDTKSNIEILWISLQLCSSVTCAVGVCYRPPDSSAEFIDSLNDSLL